MLAALTVAVCRAADDETACAKDPGSYACMLEKEREAEQTDEIAQRRVEETRTIETFLSSFEVLTNTWGCTASGVPLYVVPGDGDVMSFIISMLSQSLMKYGQHYGSTLVSTYTSAREQPKYACEGIRLDDEQHFGVPIEALVLLKSNVLAWLASNEVQGEEIVTFYITQIRQLYGRFLFSRMLSQTTNHTPAEQVPLAVLPIFETEDTSDDQCHVGGQLFDMYKDVPPHRSTRIRPMIETLLETCYTAGRISASPVDYGEILLTIPGREDQARELFDLAVQRGVLCHPYQRPDMLHRKDLTANPVWSIDSYPKSVMRAVLSLQDPLVEALPQVVFSEDSLSMQTFVASGKWERTTLFASSRLNETICASLGGKTCQRIKNFVEDVTESNDAYSFGCNGSLVLDLWRLDPNTTTTRSVGNSNIVLQLLMPLSANGNTLIATVGEETLKVDEADIVVIDDSFENTLSVQAETVSQGPMIVFHAQLCHPEMHEKVLDLPSKRCKRS